MGKGKFPIIVLLLLLIISGVFAFLYYSKAQELFDENTKLKAQNQDLNQKVDSLDRANKTLASAKRGLEDQNKVLAEANKKYEDEIKKYTERYDQVRKERDDLMVKIKDMQTSGTVQSVPANVVPTTTTTATPSMATAQDQYWQDLIVKKAELQTKLEETLDELKTKLLDLKKLERENKELKDQLYGLGGDKDSLESKIAFNERTIEILSKDLVRERTAHKEAQARLKVLKSENADLRRELGLVSDSREKLAQRLKETQDLKSILERKVQDVEGVLREKAMEIKEVQERISSTMDTNRNREMVSSNTSKAVELPPIVVKPDSSPFVDRAPIQGKVLVVNEDEMLAGIDLGVSNGVRPGAQFVVFRNNQKIATLKVVKSQENVSVCDIEEIVPGNHIMERDIVSVQY